MHNLILRLKFKLYNIIVNIKKCIISDRQFNIHLYEKAKGQKPNIENPKNFSEKLIYLKLHYRNPLITLCTDKYYVNEYLKACGCEQICKKIYGVYDDVNDILLDDLPDEFFIKCNHMSGCNYIIKKESTNINHILKLLKINLKHNWYYNLREWNYKNIRPRIICEECLKDKSGNLPIDYKFYCFSGKPKYFMVSYGEYSHNVINYKFDMEFNSIDLMFKKESLIEADEINIPDNINEMINYVNKLCKPFPHVRVDLYNIDGRIVFGELTFYSNAGVVNVESYEMDNIIGSWIDLEKYKKDMINEKKFKKQLAK